MPDVATIPFQAISMTIRQGDVALFLGAAASLVGADEPKRLPDGRRLADDLASLASYPGPHTDPLTKIGQYLVESAGDRDLLLSYIFQKFHSEVATEYKTSLTEFLESIPDRMIPRLIISTNYDTLIERVLEKKRISYVCISHIIGKSPFKGRLLVYNGSDTIIDKSCILTTKELEERLEEVSSTANPIIIYKMHGSAMLYTSTAQRQERKLPPMNSVVLTEQDYVDLLDQDVMRHVPTQIERSLQKSRFLFLGYSLEDWNFRVLLQRVREKHAAGNLRHWACLLTRDDVETEFWRMRGVNIYHVSLDDFLRNLKDALLEAVR
jgi:SIR2-like protein